MLPYLKENKTMPIKHKDPYGPYARLQRRKSQLKKDAETPEMTLPPTSARPLQRRASRVRRAMARAFFQKNIG